MRRASSIRLAIELGMMMAVLLYGKRAGLLWHPEHKNQAGKFITTLAYRIILSTFLQGNARGVAPSVTGRFITEEFWRTFALQFFQQAGIIIFRAVSPFDRWPPILPQEYCASALLVFIRGGEGSRKEIIFRFDISCIHWDCLQKT